MASLNYNVDYHELDPGIRDVVKILRDGGVETYESCQSGDGHSFPEPTVRFHGNYVAGMQAVAVALNHGLHVLDLRRCWNILDGELVGPYWEMTFWLGAKEGPE